MLSRKAAETRNLRDLLTMRAVVLNWRAWDNFLLKEILIDPIIIECEPFGLIPTDAFDALDWVDIAIVNVDLTRKDNCFENLEIYINATLRKNVRLLNSRIPTLDKQELQSTLRMAGLQTVEVPADAPDNISVIVKTRCNYGGEPERLLGLRHSSCQSTGGIETSNDYQVMDLKQARSRFLQADGVCIEKYVINQQNYFFRVYVCCFSIIIVKAYSSKIIKKIEGDPRDANCLTDRDSLDLVSNVDGMGSKIGPYIGSVLDATGIEYGSMDIVTDGREVYLIDLNTTPWGGLSDNEPFVLEYLRDGLRK